MNWNELDLALVFSISEMAALKQIPKSERDLCIEFRINRLYLQMSEAQVGIGGGQANKCTNMPIGRGWPDWADVRRDAEIEVAHKMFGEPII